MDKDTINYLEQRDFGETFNVAVKFLRQNFKKIILALLLIAGPFVVLSSIAGVIYSQSITGKIADLFRNNDFRILDLFNYQYLVSVIISALSNLIITAVIYEYMLLYITTPLQGITVTMVGKAILKDFWKIALTMFSFYLTAFVIIIVFGGISIGLSSVHWSITIFLVVLAIILAILFLPNLLYLLSTTYLVRIFGTESVFESYRTTKFAMKYNFWWTWLLMLSLFIISMIIGVAMGLPVVFIQVILKLTHLDFNEYKMLFSILTTITSTIHILLSSFLLLFIAFHHFSLTEKVEGTGLLQRINEIGKNKKQTIDQEY